MNKIILYFLSFIFLISGGYFYINHDVKKDITFSTEEANIVTKGMLPMLVEELGIQIDYENPTVDFSNNNTLINLNFEVKGFSLVFNGSAIFDSELIKKDNKIYISDLKYKDFNLINKIEKSEFSDVFVKKYKDFVKNKTMEALTITLNRKPIYYFNDNSININSIKPNKKEILISTSQYLGDYKIYYIICFILSIILFFISFFINKKNQSELN